MSESNKKWYVLRAAGGKEKKAKEYLEKEIERYKLQDFVDQVLIPTEKVVAQRGGKRVIKERNILPGYVLVETLRPNSSTSYATKCLTCQAS